MSTQFFIDQRVDYAAQDPETLAHEDFYDYEEEGGLSSLIRRVQGKIRSTRRTEEELESMDSGREGVNQDFAWSYNQPVSTYRENQEGIQETNFSALKGTPGNVVMMFHPQDLEDCVRVIKAVKNQMTVLMNLPYSLNSDPLATRLMDFVLGGLSAMDGRYKVLSEYVVLLTPAQVILRDELEEAQGEIRAADQDFDSVHQEMDYAG